LKRTIAALLISVGVIALALQVIASKRGLRQAVNANAEDILRLAVTKTVNLDRTNPLPDVITPDQPWFEVYAKNRFALLVSPKIEPSEFLGKLKNKLAEQAIEDEAFDELHKRAIKLDSRIAQFSLPPADITVTKAHKKQMKRWAKSLREYNLWPDDPRWLDAMAELATEIDEVKAEADRLKELTIKHKKEQAELELLLLNLINRTKEITSTPDELWDWNEVTNEPESIFGLIEPKLPFYSEAVKIYRRYAKLKEREFETIALKKKLRKGRSSPVVARIKERLALEGFFSGETTELFDNEFEDAVKEFQKYHGLTPDGVIGKKTLAALNKPFSEKLETIKLNLDRIRKSPARIHPKVLWINVPSYRLWLIEDGSVKFTSKVVVGNNRWITWAPPWLDEIPARARPKPTRGPWNQTPVIASAIDKVIINPRWGTSERILEELLAEQERKKESEEKPKDPLKFDKSNYIWGLHPSGKVYLYQDPSVANLLGKVKFSFPNEHQIFLHDTPGKYLFKRWPRAFSHGCIRIEKPLELAKLILELDQNEALGEWKNLLEDSSKPHVIELNNPLPIVIDYITVGPTDWSEGEVSFLEDIYALDPPESEKYEEKREKFLTYLKRLEQLKKGEIWPKRD